METFLFYFAIVYFAACTVLAISAIKYTTSTFRWNFVWSIGQKCGFVLTTALCSYIVPFRVYTDTIGKNK